MILFFSYINRGIFSITTACPDGFLASYTTSAGIIEWTDLNTTKSVRFTTSDLVGKNSTFGVFTAVLTAITDNSILASTIIANTALPVGSLRTGSLSLRTADQCVTSYDVEVNDIKHSAPSHYVQREPVMLSHAVVTTPKYL